MQFTATFQNTFDGNNGTLRFLAEDEDGVGGAQWRVRFSIVGPGGIVVKSLPTGNTWDLSFASASSIVTFVVIPKIDDDIYLSGTYQFVVEWKDNQNPANPVNTVSKSFYYCPTVTLTNPVSTDISLSLAVDCASGVVTLTNATSQTGWTIDDYALTLTPPTVTGHAVQTTTDGSELTLTDVTNYTGVTYQGDLAIERSKSEVEDELTIVHLENIEAHAELLVVCSTDICEVANCMESLFNEADAAACGSGGWHNLSAKMRARLDRANSLFNLYRMYFQCGNFNKAASYMALLKLHLDCDCGCADASTDSQPFTPPYPPSV